MFLWSKVLNCVEALPWLALLHNLPLVWNPQTTIHLFHSIHFNMLHYLCVSLSLSLYLFRLTLSPLLIFPYVFFYLSLPPSLSLPLCHLFPELFIRPFLFPPSLSSASGSLDSPVWWEESKTSQSSDAHLSPTSDTVAWAQDPGISPGAASR